MARISSRAFTLIELLIVIAIIGILMALLFPAVNGAIDAARKAQAKNDVTQIATAVIAYETEYGKLPKNANGPVNTDLVKILMAQNDTENPRKISFIEAGTAKRGKSGTNDTGFVDPWGGVYQIKVDDDYNNEVTAAGWSTVGTVTLRRKVAVWNNPGASVPNEPNAAKQKRRYVTSWE